ncbi:LysM peptidoglycan-binding domain-containing protein [Massilia antarctica]|uniref:LysM peptidoglycan-binding domain-containing protein n=1 Tax=Massilia antarctica TaxID=2765360 RepID=A0AA48WAX2_9BURK|nr:LysM peptidoglycan-binding domain-containing protein [Massilia antarctica]QPI49226.1 LysM peptidoglycan-binding domain-containing protein [Massilia antarctica]
MTTPEDLLSADLPAEDLPAEDLPADELPADDLPANGLPADDLSCAVRVKLLDPLGEYLQGLKYQVREGQKIVAKGTTDAKGNIKAFDSTVGAELSVYVERFASDDMKLIRMLSPWSEDYRVKIVSGKVLEELTVTEDKGAPGEYRRKTHKVVKNETLGQIAVLYGTTAQEIANLNGIKLESIIHIDQVLKIPPEAKKAQGASQSGAPPASRPATPSSVPAPSAKPLPSASEAIPPVPAPASKPAAPASAPNTPVAAPAPAPQAAPWPKPKTIPISAPVPTIKEESRGENGTPKTTLGLDCNKAGCIKLGDTGDLVEEINIRLMGFGQTIKYPSPLTEFTIATENAVKQFQRDYMGVAETGRVCPSVLASIDEFGRKHLLPGGNGGFDQMKCQCQTEANPGPHVCSGFGMGRTESASIGYFVDMKKHTGSKPGVERRGIHRALFWSLKAAIFYLHVKESNLGCKVDKISSGFRCWRRAQQMKTFTTNHMGDAVDFWIKDKTGHVCNSDLEKVKNKVFVAHMKARPTWDTKNAISLEPTKKAGSWVHMDVREFASMYKPDRFYSRNLADANGVELMTLAKQKSLFALVNCGGVAAKLPVQPSAGPKSAAPKSSPGNATPPLPPVSSTPKPSPASTPVPKPNPSGQKSPTAGSGKIGPVIGAPSEVRRDAKSLQVSQAGINFIRIWESGNLTKTHLTPYNDSKKLCTIGVGHLIDGKVSCEVLRPYDVSGET